MAATSDEVAVADDPTETRVTLGVAGDGRLLDRDAFRGWLRIICFVFGFAGTSLGPHTTVLCWLLFHMLSGRSVNMYW